MKAVCGGCRKYGREIKKRRSNHLRPAVASCQIPPRAKYMKIKRKGRAVYIKPSSQARAANVAKASSCAKMSRSSYSPGIEKRLVSARAAGETSTVKPRAEGDRRERFLTEQQQAENAYNIGGEAAPAI